jgi:hypothetical protein
MADRKTTSVERHFTEGRRYPRGRNMDPGADLSVRRSPAFETGNRPGRAFNSDRPQDAEDMHDVGYANDASGWVRGAKGQPTGFNETATNYPDGNFDRSNAWRSRDGSIHGPDKGDPGIMRKPEPNKP